MDLTSEMASSNEDGDPIFWTETNRHQELSVSYITNLLFKICEPQLKCSEEVLVKLSNMVIEKLICESPLTEILRTIDSVEFYNKFLEKKEQFDFNKFISVCRYLCQSDKQGYDIIGLYFFSKNWKNNTFFQYEFIKHCVLFDYVQRILNSCTHTSLTRKVPQLELLKYPPEYDTDYQISCWKYQCLSFILLELSDDQSLFKFLEEIFFLPVTKCPDLLVFALLEYQKNCRLKDVILVKSFLNFIYVSPNNPNPNPNITLIIQRIWPNDFVYTSKTSLSSSQKALLTSMVELYTSSSPQEQSQKLSKILDLSQDLKVLTLLLSSNSYSFVIDLACFASRREYLKLDKWLNDKIQQVGTSFVKACVSFLRDRCSIFGEAKSGAMPLPNETNIIITCLRQFVIDTPNTGLDFEIIKMFNEYTQLLSQSQLPNNQVSALNLNQSENQIRGSQLMTSSSIPQSQTFYPESDQDFSQEIVEEADSYFQRIYNQDQPDSLSIDKFLEMLKNFQESMVKKEKEVAACMIRNLFKEYPFLHQYPEKELVITGEIFGGIIMNNLLKGFHVINALRFLVEALKKPLDSKYFIFGQAALNKIKPRLKEYPHFCNHLCSIPNFHNLSHDLKIILEFGKNGMDASLSVLASKQLNLKGSHGNFNESTQIISPDPPNSFQDKVAFIINNLSQLTIAKKAEDFKELFLTKETNDQYLRWFANYFVMKRVSLEANFHDLYACFLIKISMIELSSRILQETYKNVKALLTANKETDNQNDRTLLKNLGQWLGLMTLAQNKPVLTIDLDLKDLIIEAYHKGTQQLQYVLPFVAKVLAGSAKSKVFRPPCPWTVKLLKLLGELHSEPELKLNLKFEVEVLCQNLDIDYRDYVGKSQDLKNKDYLSKIGHQLGGHSVFINNNINNKIITEINSVSSSQHSSFDIIGPIQTSASVTGVNVPTNYNENLSHSLVVQIDLPVMINPNFKNMIKSLIVKNVQDWISFISERVIKVCLVTTETLVRKDFQNESQPELMRVAAHKMMRCLVSGYSLINSQEPLINRLQLSLQNLFLSKLNSSPRELIDTAVANLVNDNIESCVNFVQKTCVERGIEELDKKIKTDFERKTTETKMPSLSLLQQIKIYEEMDRNMTGFTSNSTASTNQPVNYPVQLTEMSKNTFAINVAPSPASFSQTDQPPTPQTDTFVSIYEKLIKHLTELIQEFQYIHYTTDGMNKVSEILKLAKLNPRDQNTGVTLIKSVINGLRELFVNAEGGVTDLAVISRARDFYLLLLKALSDQRAFNYRFTTSNITRFVMEYWITNNKSFPDDLFDTLRHASLINFNYMDNEFYLLLESGQNTLAINVILNFLKVYLNALSPNHFIATLELLQRIAFKVNQTNHPLINDLKTILTAARINFPSNLTPEITEMPDKAELIFKEWIQCYNSPESLNTSFSNVVKNMNIQGLLKNDDMISHFFKTFLDFIVKQCHEIFNHPSIKKCSLTQIHMKCYECVDAFSVLVLMFIKQTGNQGNVEQKFQFLNRILTILTSTALKDQNLIPITYYRILLYIFIDFFHSPFNFGIQDMIINNDSIFEILKWHFVRSYCNVLQRISPLKLPSFTFAWFDIISHRVFIGKCLDNTNPQINYKIWQAYYILLSEILMFQKPILETLLLPNNLTTMQLYKGTLKLFLILYHDFPEFLCDYAYNLCDSIPSKAVQLRNIILSANSINIPDGLQLKDNLYEILPSVRVSNNSLVEQISFKKELDSYLSTRNSVAFLTDLPTYLCSHNLAEKQMVYNISVINALTHYVGTSAIQAMKSITISSVSNSAHINIFQTLLISFDSQGRYILINAMVDHLRYPNTETLFFIYLLISIFKEGLENIREQIIRVILERIIPHSPHPWGLVFLLNELIRNPAYKLLEHNFIKCVPEIEKVLTNFFQGVIGFISNSVNCNDIAMLNSR